MSVTPADFVADFVAVESAAIESLCLLVLACSYKQGGYCAAGLVVEPDAAGNWCASAEWLRPVARDGSGCGALLMTDITCSNGRKVCTGDVVRCQVFAGKGIAGQPENRVVTGVAWEFLETVDASQIPSLVEQPAHVWLDSCAPSNRVQGCIVQSGQVQESLMLVQPHNLQLLLSHRTDFNGKARKRIQASFDYAGQHYEGLSVTCPAVSRMLKNRFPVLGGAEVCMTLNKGDQYVLCLSLSPDFNGFHYKLVAAVYDYDGYLNRTFAH